jgi:hypothetical protein
LQGDIDNGSSVGAMRPLATIRHRHAPRVFALGFDMQRQGRAGHHRWVNRHGHGEGIVQRHSFLWRTALERGSRQLPNGLGLNRVLATHMLIEKGWREARLAGDIQGYPGHSDAGGGDDSCRVWIHKNVEFCSGGNVAGNAHSPTHHDEMSCAAHRVWRLADCLGDIG